MLMTGAHRTNQVMHVMLLLLISQTTVCIMLQVRVHDLLGKVQGLPLDKVRSTLPLLLLLLLLLLLYLLSLVTVTTCCQTER